MSLNGSQTEQLQLTAPITAPGYNGTQGFSTLISGVCECIDRRQLLSIGSSVAGCACMFMMAGFLISIRS